MNAVFIRLLGMVAIVAVCGCGGGGPPKIEKQATVTVTGILTYQGKPLGDASVTFQSLDGKVAARGTSDKAGTFRLSTYGTDDGVPPGMYKVVVAVSGVKEIEPGVLAPEPAGGFKSPIPTKYANPATTDITKEVKPEGGTITIDLK